MRRGVFHRNFAIVLTITVAAILSLTPALSSEEQPIPFYADVAVTLPTVNAGPTAPLALKPGECTLLVLRDEYSSSTLTDGYAWRVDYVDGKPLLLNYTISVRRLASGEVEVCIPGSIESGVYDLVLTGSTVLVVPRAIWVVESLPKRLRIVIVSDIHFGVIGKTDLWRYSAAMIVNSLNPDLVIWTGDIQDSDAEYTARLAQVYRYTMYYKYPVFSVPGNHDRPGTHYSAYLGPRTWARVVADKLLVIGVYTDPGFYISSILSWDQVAFIEEVLSNYSYVPVKIIAMHYPMFYCREPCVVHASYDDEEVLKPFAEGVETPVSSYWSTNMSEFRYVLKLIEDYNVTAVVAGHIHRDQYVLYVSRRTGGRTHFITTTSSGQLTPAYPGVRVFEIDMESGEVTLPEHPLVGIFSIPIEYQGVGVYASIVRGSEAYKISVQNKLSWFNISFSTVIPLPWTPVGPDPLTIVLETLDESSAEVKHVLRFGNYTYVYIKLHTPYRGFVSLVVYRTEDTKPLVIQVKEWIPKTPTLNRTLTIYFYYIDEEWGVDPDSVRIESNCTVRISTRVIPGTYIAVFDKLALEVKLTMTASNTTACILTLRGSDNAGKLSEKKYIVVFYPPGATPSEQPVREFLEAVDGEQPVETEVTETTTTIPVTETPQPPEETLQPITETQISETTPARLEQETSIPIQEPAVKLSDVLLVSVVIAIATIAVILYLSRSWIKARRAS